MKLECSFLIYSFYEERLNDFEKKYKQLALVIHRFGIANHNVFVEREFN